MSRVHSALLTLLVLGSGMASADDWPGPRVFAVFSENGRYFVRIVPGESVGDTVGFAGAPKGKYATALLYALQPDRAYRLQHEITLTNRSHRSARSWRTPGPSSPSTTGTTWALARWWRSTGPAARWSVAGS